MKAGSRSSTLGDVLGPAALLAILLAPLVVHAYLGTFSRYVADDYCTAAKVKELGFWGSQGYWYDNWTGRYASNAVLGLLELAGPWAVRVIPGAALVVWTVGLAWTLSVALPQSLVGIFSRKAFLPCILSTLAVGLTLAASPDVYQSVYWQTGLVTYTLPLVFLTLEAGLLALSAAPHPLGGVVRGALPSLVGLLAVVSAAFSETNLIMQILFFVAALAWFHFLPRGAVPGLARWEAAVGLAGTLLAAGFVILAPGNAVRMASMPERAAILPLLVLTLRYSVAFLAKAFLAAPFGYVLAAILSVCLGARWTSMRGGVATTGREMLGHVLFVAAACGVLVVALVFPSAYATAAYPVDRALIGPAYVSALAVLAVGLLLGFMVGARRPAWDMFSRSWKYLALMILCGAALSAVEVVDAWRILPDARAYASGWDRRLKAIEAAQESGVRTLTLDPLPHIASLAELQNEPSDWVNLCFASYHGFDAVMVKEPG